MSSATANPAATNPISTGVDALHDLRITRRRNRMQSIHWSDTLYRFYVVVVAGSFLLAWASSAIGSREVTGTTYTDVRSRAAAAVGLVLSLLFGAALRSGSRGGPLAIEAADLAHVLQAPIDRRISLWRPFVHQIRKGLFQGLLVGGAVGVLVHPFLPGGRTVWVLSLAILGAMAGLVSIGLAGIASGMHLKRWIASLMAFVLVGSSLFDVLRDVPTGSIAKGSSPMTILGAAGAYPLWDVSCVGGQKSCLVLLGADTTVLKYLPFVLLFLSALATLFLAWRRLGRVSLELVERRTALVSQLRFAVTTQDLRTAMLLRRQLTAERSRPRPWFRIKGRGGANAAVVIRGIRNLARWPGSRLIRLGLGAAIAGFFARAAWEGAIPFVVVSGLIFFVLGLDALEALAQDADHPDFPRSFPRHLGRLANRHMVVPAFIMTMVGIVAGLSATVSGLAVGRKAIAAMVPGAKGSAPFQTTIGLTILVAIVCCICAALMALAGSALNLSLGPPSFMTMLQTPEMAYARSGIAPGMAIAGSALPYFLVRASLRNAQQQSPISGLFQSASATALIAYLVLTVLTSRGVTKNDRV